MSLTVRQSLALGEYIAQALCAISAGLFVISFDMRLGAIAYWSFCGVYWLQKVRREGEREGEDPRVHNKKRSSQLQSV